MDLEKVTARIRPRRGWEAIDLGVSLVQRHAKTVYSIWFVTSFPVFIILSLVLGTSPEWAAIILWWLKPILERPLLHLFSRELFGETLTVKQCVKSFFSVAKIQWFASLTWRRLSFTRSLDLPLIQLEGLSGAKRSNRLKTLHSGESNSAVWLTIMFFIVEMTIYFSIISLIYLLLPEVYLEDFDIWGWLTADSDSVMMSHLFNFLAYLGISLVAPFYIACGFTLYLNQRTHLEAWDIELSFKRLASRLSEKSENLNVRLASFLLTTCLVFSSMVIDIPNASAAETELLADKTPVLESALRDLNKPADDLTFDAPENSLSHQQIKQMINEIKEGEDFHQKETQQSNEYRGSDSDSWFDDEPSDISPGWLVFAKIFALIVEFALWIFVAVLIIFLIVKYKHLLGNTFSNKKIKNVRPKKLFGLDLDTESLPEQPWLVAKQLVLEDKYRQAVSLLYRASLIWYIDNSNVLIKEGYTELECLTQIVKHVGSSSQNYIKSLTINWRGLAYAHINPEKSILIELCDQWPQVMKVHSDNLNQVNIAKNSSAERSNG